MTDEVLVDGPTFFVTNDEFEVGPAGGLFHEDTRYLSALTLSLADASLVPVGSHLKAPWRRVVTAADIDSAINKIDGSEAQKHTSLAVTRDQVVAEAVGLVERITVRNHSPRPRTLSLSVEVAADFKDLFEVRELRTGIDRDVTAAVGDDRIRYRYDATPGASLTVGFDPAPATLTAAGATYDLSLAAQAETTLTVVAAPDDADPALDASAFDAACRRAGTPILAETTGATTGLADTAYGSLFEHAHRDLQALVTQTDHGAVPLAGVPWFATVFGRDALLTAYNMLHVTPALAEGTLRYLAARQGTTTDAYRDEQPGKIFHEIRHGELATQGHIPHGPYYGTIDATPLWLIVLHETHRWTGDDDLLCDLWPAAREAADWLTRTIDDVGDDPFLYYEAAADDAVAHKAWRDTERSVQYADGEAATGPLASVEVQGYVYDAFTRFAALARHRGDPDVAREYEARADALHDRFNDVFWLPDRAFYGAARTSSGRVVDSATSNVGQCLWSGIVAEDRADAVVDTLLAPGLNSGWGIRTMSAADAGYSPVSYHVGSVWPHDNALIALGTNAYGYRDATETIASSVLAACRTFDRQRIPELYCGFGDDAPPYAYPAACEPQAWSASTPFALLRALYDVRPDDAAYARPTTAPTTLDITPDRVAALTPATQRPTPEESE